MRRSEADVVVLGAGAAGLFCAAEAGKRGRRVIVLERSDRPGRKILISGGGRCNFTNRICQPGNYLSSNRHFCKSALARYDADEFVRLVERHRIPYHEKTLGQLFCDRSSRDILDMLVRECTAAGVQVVTGVNMHEVHRDVAFTVQTSEIAYCAPVLVVATGGLSIPKLGATSFGYDVARQFGLRIVPPRPALVPLLFSEAQRTKFGKLSGVSLSVEATFNGQSFLEKMLITHRGLSGPAILQISSYWNPGVPLTIDLLPGVAFENYYQTRRASGSNAELRTLLAELLPKRFIDAWLTPAAPGDMPREIDQLLHRWSVLPAGTEGYAKAEVTAGGVDTNDLSSKTMEAKNVPGLFFVGEVVDVTGWLGGYNFQWAWSSAFAAAQAV